MGAKKGKKGKGQEDEDNPTENFLPAYKKACKENERRGSEGFHAGSVFQL